RTGVFARAEAVRFAWSEEALCGEVVEGRFAGAVYVYKVAVEGGELEVQTGGAGGAGDREARVGDRVGLEPVAAPEGLFAFPDDPGSGE
ncbi:MAG: TOBE domain-containing protein, partial [Candidatus Palauibacterales bacterium]|nr:TOBE domain-containing protein [Candidatus Palauibacterales bacterium]